MPLNGLRSARCSNLRMHSLPPLFLSHGSPMMALEPREAGAFMQTLGAAVTRRFGKPQAIVIASAHTTARVPVLLAGAMHHAIHDFGGFDPRLNQMRYDAPGAPALAARVAALMHAAGLPAQLADASGLDHGIWTALRYVFPDASVPVLPLAWPSHWPPAQLLALGQSLAALANEGVLIIGSGSITHNLARVFASGSLHPQADAPATPESTAFRDWFAQKVAAADWPALCDYRQQAPHAVLMHPTDEHLLPFFIAAGAGLGAAGATASAGPDALRPGVRLHASLTFGDLGMDAYAFGASAQALSAANLSSPTLIVPALKP
jgi:4,5-DOPA dioxygenase extradiol